MTFHLNTPLPAPDKEVRRAVYERCNPRGWPEWFWEIRVLPSYMFALACALDGYLADNFEARWMCLVNDKSW